MEERVGCWCIVAAEQSVADLLRERLVKALRRSLVSDMFDVMFGSSGRCDAGGGGGGGG